MRAVVKPTMTGFNGIFENGVGVLQSKIGTKKGTRLPPFAVVATLGGEPCLLDTECGAKALRSVPRGR